jgi:phosphoglycolate phosphatase-like HAD superfamily hydrolase
MVSEMSEITGPKSRVPVFISWSGDVSGRIAAALRSWLPFLLPDIELFLSSIDITPGARWAPTLANRLDKSHIGVICVTPENLTSSWLLFEAGALSRELGKNRVCPLLYGINPSSLEGPLSQFQCLQLDEDGLLAIVRMLNAEMPTPLPEEVVPVWVKNWLPKFGFPFSVRDTEGRQPFTPAIAELEPINEKDAFEHMVKEGVECIKIIGHTGSDLVRQFIAWLDRQYGPHGSDISIDVLLRNPASEISSRAEQIRSTVHMLEERETKGHKNIQVRYYESLPAVRGVLALTSNRHTEHEGCLYVKSGFVSFYYYPLDMPSKKFPAGTYVKDRVAEENAFSRLFLSWFNHLWGKPFRIEGLSNPIHTILFDFDDTLVATHQIQIQAWCDTIDKALEGYGVTRDQIKVLGDAALDNGTAANDEEIRLRVQKTFFEKQRADRIFESIFSLDDKKTQEIKEGLHQWRFRRRQELMKESSVRFFPGVKDVIARLSRHYNLVIISATDEKLVKDFLKNETLSDGSPIATRFWYIIGKSESDFDWKNVERKSQLMFKVTHSLGVPLTSVLYVGDNEGDRQAAKQIKVRFAEARLFAEEVSSCLGKQSLLSDAGARELYFQKWVDFEKDILDPIENRGQGIENSGESFS